MLTQPFPAPLAKFLHLPSHTHAVIGEEEPPTFQQKWHAVSVTCLRKEINYTRDWRKHNKVIQWNSDASSLKKAVRGIAVSIPPRMELTIPTGFTRLPFFRAHQHICLCAADGEGLNPWIHQFHNKVVHHVRNSSLVHINHKIEHRKTQPSNGVTQRDRSAATRIRNHLINLWVCGAIYDHQRQVSTEKPTELNATTGAFLQGDMRQAEPRAMQCIQSTSSCSAKPQKHCRICVKKQVSMLLAHYNWEMVNIPSGIHKRWWAANAPHPPLFLPSPLKGLWAFPYLRYDLRALPKPRATPTAVVRSQILSQHYRNRAASWNETWKCMLDVWISKKNPWISIINSIFYILHSQIPRKPCRKLEGDKGMEPKLSKWAVDWIHSAAHKLLTHHYNTLCNGWIDV